MDDDIDATSDELLEIFQRIEPKLKTSQTDAKILEAFGDFQFKNQNYVEATRLYQKSFDISKLGKLLYKIWDSFQSEGYVAKAGEYGQQYLDYIFKYRIQQEIEKFLVALENTGFDRKKLVYYKLKRDITQGNVAGVIEGIGKIELADEFAQVEIAAEFLRKRKFWKTIPEIRQSLFDLYINLIPVDEEEERVLKRQLLESMFAELLENGLTGKIDQNLKKYSKKYNSDFGSENNISEKNYQLPEFTKITSSEDLKQQIEFLIQAREFEDAKNLVDDMLLGGFDKDEVERLERRIKIKEEAMLKDVTMVKNLLLEEIDKFRPQSTQKENVESDNYSEHFKIKIVELAKNFTFTNASKIFNEMGMLKSFERLDELIDVCKKNYSNLTDSEKTELEYFNLTKMYEDKDYLSVAAVTTKIVKNRPLNKNEMAMFLLIKKKAYINMDRHTEADDVEKAIKLIFTEN